MNGNETSSGPIHKLIIILEMIKFEHTVFALPFALISTLIAAKGLPDYPALGWIIVAMVGARSAAMTFNRIADAKIDKMNPRTASRAIPRGIISTTAAWMFTIVSAGLLVFAAYMLNALAFALSPVALAAIGIYSYTKRFTSLSHVWLGLCLGIAPVGAWIAVTGKMGFPSMVLSAAVIFWSAGFDIIYSLQDIDFDQKMGLFSLPARFGPRLALFISRLFHLFVICLLVWFGNLCRMGSIYYAGVVVVSLILFFEQKMVTYKDFSRVNTAFFTMNSCVSLILLLFVIADVYL